MSIKDGKPVWELCTVDAPLEDGSESSFIGIFFSIPSLSLYVKFILPNNFVLLGLDVDNISSFTLTLKRIYAYLYSEPSSSGASTVPNSKRK